MNLSNSEMLIGALSNTELKDLIIAYKRYAVERGVNNPSPLLNKLCEAYVKSSHLEFYGEVISTRSGKMGVAEYKLAEAAGHC